jgi:hypothetical protein
MYIQKKSVNSETFVHDSASYLQQSKTRTMYIFIFSIFTGREKEIYYLTMMKRKTWKGEIAK